MRAAIGAALLVSACGLLAPAPASADFEGLYTEYRDFGLIDGCGHPESEMRKALEDIPPDIRAYDPGFADALGAALEQRAVGCEGEGSEPAGSDQGGIATAGDGSPGPADPEPLAAEDTGAGETPAAMVVMLAALAAALAGLGLLAALGGRALSLPGPIPGAARRLRAVAERIADIAFVLRSRIGS